MRIALLTVLAWFSWTLVGASAALVEPPAQKFGLHEVVLAGTPADANPFDTVATVRFTPPSGAARRVTVQAFYDGGTTAGPAVAGGREVELTSPWPGHDAVLWLRRMGAVPSE